MYVKKALILAIGVFCFAFPAISNAELSNTEPPKKVTQYATSGWVEIDGKWYYYKDGVTQTGWQQINGGWYYFNGSGAMQTDWQSINGAWYYFNSSGAMQTGWQYLNGNWYYLDTYYGDMQKGKLYKEDNLYFLDKESGAMKTGWVSDGDNWMYMASDGKAQKDWLELNGSWYFLNRTTYEMITKTRWIDRSLHHFRDDGVWLYSDDKATVVSEDGYAESNETATQETNTLELQWENTGDYYEIYKGGKILWKGTDKSYVDNFVSSDSSEIQKYILVSYKDNKVVDVKNISSSSKKKFEDNKLNTFNSSSNGKELDNLVRRTIVDSEATTKYVKLKWDGIPDKDGIFQVYRDGQLIGETSSLEFVDKNIENNKTYNYKITASRSLTNEEKNEMDQKLKNAKSTSIKNEDFYTRHYQLAKVVSTPEIIKSREDVVNFVQAKSGFNYHTYLRYTTFIPDPKAPNPFGLLTGSYFKGDDRGFHPTGSFRTRATFEAAWTRDNAALYHNFETQPTVLYRANGSEASRKQASTSGMELSNISKYKSSRNCYMNSDGKCKAISFTMSHDVGIPIYDYFTPDITYDFRATMYEDDTILLNGTHDQAPSHEIYLTTNTLLTKNWWVSYYTFTNKGFSYLLPPAPDAEISIKPYVVFSLSN
ncbi:hypothetical protein [Bacillus pseudomycoides]|uniref:hypothetical protein n=1 Tax=Bacillus pseudomycoides TaxID=64104 RepID=UPI0020D2879D|nr:hypothetical protein [Bacillus pseudomycoides]